MPIKFISTDNLQDALQKFYAKTNETYAPKNHGTHLTLGTGSGNAFRGDYGNTAYQHSQTAHAPSNAQKNSDITKAEIEAKLTGNITSHSHTTVNGYSIWVGTKAEYDAITSKSSTTLYHIKE